MTLKKCILTANDCYKKNQKMTGNKPTGIVVHSTGANNKTLKRYVQPLKTDIDYATIINDIGINKYDNHWNKSVKEMGRSVCVHAFIGVNAAGKVETYQTLPFDVCCWGCGSAPFDKYGNKLSSSKDSRFDHYGPSYNYNPQARVQFEICEDGLTDRNYFDKAMTEAIEFCAYLCEKYDLSVDSICSHDEAYERGYGSNHGDPDHWLKKFGKNMAWFRAEVQKKLNALKVEPPKVSVPAKPKPIQTTTTQLPTIVIPAIEIGDIVEFTGSRQYASTNSSISFKAKAGKVKIIDMNQYGKHRYRGYTVDDKGEPIMGAGRVYAWIDAYDIKAVKNPADSWEPKIGDLVMYNGNVHYNNANGVTPLKCKGGLAKITGIYQLGKSKHPYHLVRINGKGSDVYGWVDEGTFTKA